MAQVSSIENQTGPHSSNLAAVRRRRVFSAPLEDIPVVAIRRVQLQFPLPSGREPRDDERIRRQLDLGWRIAQLQRLSDQEVLVTFEALRSDPA